MSDQDDCVTKTTSTFSVEAHGPGGFWGSIRGIGSKEILFVIIIALMIFVLWYQADRIAETVAKRDLVTQELLVQITKAQAANMAVNVGKQDDNTKALKIMTYVLSLDQAERKQLKLTMPEELKYGYKR